MAMFKLATTPNNTLMSIPQDENKNGFPER
jgi:hypothetical protein